MLSLHARDLEKGGWLHRYGFPASVFFFITELAFWVILYTRLVPASVFPYFVLGFVCVELVLGAIMIVSAARSWGKLILVPLLLGVVVGLAYLPLHLLGLVP
jgi:hypothetical protein